MAALHHRQLAAQHSRGLQHRPLYISGYPLTTLKARDSTPSERDGRRAIGGWSSLLVMGDALELQLQQLQLGGVYAPGAIAVPAQHSNVYLRGLPQGVDEAALVSLFERFGEVASIRVFAPQVRHVTGLHCIRAAGWQSLLHARQVKGESSLARA